MIFGELTSTFWRLDQNLASWFFWRLGIWRVVFFGELFFRELTTCIPHGNIYVIYALNDFRSILLTHLPFLHFLEHSI